MGPRGPWGLGRVFGERFAARRYERTEVTAPNPLAPRAKANRPAPLQAGARSTRRGSRAGVVDLLEWGFVWGLLEPLIACLAKTLPCRVSKSEDNLTQSFKCKPQGSKGTSDHGARASDCA